jgi:hypothetical protein
LTSDGVGMSSAKAQEVGEGLGSGFCSMGLDGCKGAKGEKDEVDVPMISGVLWGPRGSGV